MKDFQSLFIPLVLVQRLIAKGFSEKCLGYFTADTGKVSLFEIMPLDKAGLEANETYDGGTLAPMYEDVIDWLTTKNLLIVIDNYSSGYSFVIRNCPPYTPANFFKDKSEFGYKTRREALDKAIEEAITLLP